MESLIEISPKHLICFSHLRWDFVFQRPQHLLSRFAKDHVVYFFEEPIFDATAEDFLSISKREDNLHVVVPHLKEGMSSEFVNASLAALLDKILLNANLNEWMFWYYTPMAYYFASKYKPKLVIYDCMDELSAFKFAPKEITALEEKLMVRADLVFTGGVSLYEAKKQKHANIFPFPSSIDREHFAQAKILEDQPLDQKFIAGTKLGFFGVIDERFDIDLIKNIAIDRPDWQIILIGPVVKISPDTLPKLKNIHYLGQKSYTELPAYLAGWDIALIPFLLNESTRYISPTKTPEYLAAGIPVVSTPIHDVINPYGIKNLVHISASHEGFIKIIESEMVKTEREGWLEEVDRHLMYLSWDQTYSEMKRHIMRTIKNVNRISIAS